MSEADSDSHLENVPLAFVLTLAASLATSVGALASFSVRLQDRKVLAGSLGLAAGVMVYVSFVEIFDEARSEFASYKLDNPDTATPLVLTTMYFFLGMIIIAILDEIVHRLEEMVLGQEDSLQHHLPTMRMDAVLEHHAERIGCVDSTFEMEEVKSSKANVKEESRENRLARDQEAPTSALDTVDAKELSQVEVEVVEKLIDENKRYLRRASLTTAIAIALHNFPEGITAFVATLADPRIGISVSVAIAIHNIPEGLCVAMPLLFATGSRWKAFFWSSVSGLSEFLGALVGYTLLKGFISAYVFGVAFSIVGGMMVFVSFRELLPVARKYDPDDKVVSWSVVAGMTIMAISLVLFEF